MLNNVLLYKMYYSPIYQTPDSIANNKSKNGLGLELLEEVDEVKIPKPKKKYSTHNKVDTVKKDTVYGIKNEVAIPTRQIKIKPQTETIEEILFNPKPMVKKVENWQTITLITAVLLLGIVKAFSSNRFRLSIKALLNYSVAQEINREEKVFFHRSNVLFTIIHLLTTALFIYQLSIVFNPPPDDTISIVFYFKQLSFLVFIYLVKYLFSKVLFYILNDNSLSDEYIFNISLYNNLLGVCLIIVLCTIYFSNINFSSIILYFSLPVVLIVFLLRIIRLFVIGKSKGISYYYIFLYICTLEILPLVVLYRIFILK